MKYLYFGVIYKKQKKKAMKVFERKTRQGYRLGSRPLNDVFC